jgi:hypothetical protein
MALKTFKPGRLAAGATGLRRGRIRTGLAESAGNGPSNGPSNGKLRSMMSPKNGTSGNLYHCAMERNQNGKYNIRIRVQFERGAWSLSVYFLASSFNAGMKKLEESLQLLQKSEERLRFWAVERTDDPNLAGDLLRESGLWLDRRRDFPRKVAEMSVASGRSVPASSLAPVRRVLADSVSQERERAYSAAAGD